MNFILEPSPIPLRIVEVVPPEPAKLVDQVARVLDLVEDLPPVDVRAEVIDLCTLAQRLPADHYLFPCRGSERKRLGRSTSSIAVPRARTGPRRMRTIAPDPRAFLRGRPRPSRCPRELVGTVDGPTLTKCCLLEDRVEREGSLVVVPWGASSTRSVEDSSHRACHGGAGVGARLTDSALYGHLWATDELREVFEERGRLGTWLEILAALAESQAELRSSRATRPRRSVGRQTSTRWTSSSFRPRPCGPDTTLGLIRGSSGSCRPRLASGSTSAARCRT